MSLPPLKSLPVFEAVARLNSFSKAALELNLTQSAVSHQIKILENYLGESLFSRHGRHLEITPDGKLYLDSIATSLTQIARASNHIKGHEQTQVRLAVYSSFAVYWLIPRLSDLKRRYPQLEVSIEMTHGTPELSDRTADCFITIDKHKRGFSFETLYQERLFPVCSPNLWTQIQADIGSSDHKVIQQYLQNHPEFLARYPLITSYSIFEQYCEDWRLWFNSQAHELPAQATFQKFSHLMLVYEAAKHDQGIALVNDYMLNDYMLNDYTQLDGLIAIPTHAVNTTDQFSFVYKTSRRNELGIHELRQWIRQQSISLSPN